MIEKIKVFYAKCKEKYNELKEKTLRLIEEIKKLNFWKKYVLVLWILFNIVIILLIVDAATDSPKAWGFWAFFLFLFLWRLVIAPIGRVIKYFDDKDKAKKQAQQEEKNKELQDLQLSIRDSLREGRYPGMPVDIILPDDEFCLNVFWVVVYKTKTRTKSIAYSWLRYRVRIAKGLSYTIWNISPARETISYQYVDDSWIMYLTNKRIVVKLKKKVDNIPYEKILYTELIPWGVEIYKQTGATLTYHFVWDYEKFPIYLSECLNYQKELQKVTQKKPRKRKNVDEVEIIEDPKPWHVEVLKIQL